MNRTKEVINTEQLEKITIIIPHITARKDCIAFFIINNIHIIVSDSSHLHCPFAIDQFENVVYRHFPDTHFFVKIKEIIPLIQTPYIVYVAEDDFTTPEGISQCVQFLESHPDYTSAQGHYLTFEPNRKRVKFTPRYIRNLNSQITGETARERLVSKGSLYGSLLYAAVRTEAFKKTYEVCFDPANKNTV